MYIDTSIYQLNEITVRVCSNAVLGMQHVPYGGNLVGTSSTGVVNIGQALLYPNKHQSDSLTAL